MFLWHNLCEEGIKMKRRDIIKGLLPIALAPIVATGKEETSEEIKEYKGFKILWSGWNTVPESGKVTGFYLAEREDISFSSCTGGYAAEYKLGCILNTCVLADHKFLMFYSSEEDKKEEQKRALVLLLKMVDVYHNSKK